MFVIRLFLVLWLSVSSGLVLAAATPWVDFQIVNGLVVIPTEIQGVKGHSVIDTGANITGIGQKHIAQNGLKLTRTKPMKVQGVHDSSVRKVYRDVPVTLMGSQTLFKQVVDLDLPKEAQLLIGGDYLRNLYFQFDYPNQRLRGLTRDMFDLKKISNVKSKLDPGSGQPMVKVRMNDEVNVWLVLDTGNSGGVLIKRSIAQKNGWLDSYGSEQVRVQGVVSAGSADVFRLPVIGFGPFNVKNARVSVPPEGQPLSMFRNHRSPVMLRQKTKGLLGFDVLKNFLVTIDYRSGAVFVEMPEAEAPKSS